MFETRVAIGERVAVWRAPSIEPARRLRVLLPGQGTSTRERAMTAGFVPSVQGSGRKTMPAMTMPAMTTKSTTTKSTTTKSTTTKSTTTKSTTRTVKGRGAQRDGRGTDRHRVVLPGDPTDTDAAYARWRGHPGDARTEMDRALRLGLIDGVTEVGVAMMDLGCWRTRISSLPPGPDLVTALTQRPDALAPAPVSDPDEALAAAWAARDGQVADRVVTGWANAVLESVTARARVLSWLQAEQYSDLAMLSRNYPGLAEMLPTEVGFALRTSDRIAGNAISTARTMTLRLPRTLEALRAGLIDAGHAMGLASATATTTAEVAAAVEADLLPDVTRKGSTITAEQLRRRAVRRVIIRDPDGAADRHRKARKTRTMTRWIEDDGMAGLKVLAPAEQIAAIWEAATGLADTIKAPGDTRNLGQRRVDGLNGLCLDVLTGTRPEPAQPAQGQPVAAQSGPTQSAPTEPAPTGATSKGEAGPQDQESTPTTSPATPTDDRSEAADEYPAFWTRPDLPARHGRRPHIQVLVPYTVLLGSNDPCELTGHGAITADQARAIAADGILQRILYDPASGIVLDYGRTRYQPPETLKQFIIARDRTCRTPGCLQPADRCQIDHLEPFRPGQPTGGRTRHTDLDGKCLHHHRAKDGGGFLNTRDPDGTTHWTTPLGRTYNIPPPQVIEPVDINDDTGDTDDLDDRFPPELRKTTAFFQQPKPGSPVNPADVPGRKTKPDNPTGAPNSSADAPLEDEPPF